MEIDVYEQERMRRAAFGGKMPINDFVEYDEASIKWNRGLLNSCDRNKAIAYSSENNVKGMFRPFCMQWLYYASELNGMMYQTTKLFPNGLKNLVIDVCDRGAFISSILPDLELMHHGQCFPLYWYEEAGNGKYIRHDAITDEALTFFRKNYPNGVAGKTKNARRRLIEKEDIFYYIYGILHSEEYRSRFASNLKKELPRIPLADEFEPFYQAGKALAELHLNYESAELYPLTMVWNRSSDSGQLSFEDFYNDPGPVEKMRWGKKRNSETGKMEPDKSVLVYNSRLTFKEIPESANRYIVNGRSPLEWMIDRYQVKTDSASGIVNDPNLYSEDPLYISNLVRRLVTVSVETMKIVDSLTKINEKDCYLDVPEAWRMQQG